MSCLVLLPVAGCVVVIVAIGRSLSLSLSFARLTAVRNSNSIENNDTHLFRKRFGVAVDSRVIPSVDPVDHAEQAHHRSSRVEVEAALPAEVFHQPQADAVVFALDAGDLRAQAVLQRVVFMREDLQPLLIAHEILEVILNEDADALFRIRDPLEPGLEPFKNSGEAMLLNEVQQALFGLDVVIEPRQRHASSARKVAHGSAFVSLLAENFYGMVKNLSETAVETGRRGRRKNISAATGSAGCRRRGHAFERSF